MSAPEPTAEVIMFPTGRARRADPQPAQPSDEAAVTAEVIELAAFRAGAPEEPTPDRAA